MRKITVLNGITFLAAFLLFQLELIISKMLLPDFGGSYLVWGACVVFFQTVLFLGYFFACVILRKIGIERFLPFYLGLFLLPLLCFPGRGIPVVQAVNFNFPLVLNVFWRLVLTIGPVFFVLSTVSVVLQAWLADSQLPEKNNPYTLYAVSNLGSFAALITYPFIFEALMSLPSQLLLWRGVYFLLTGLVIFAVASVKVKSETAATKIWSLYGIPKQTSISWFLFSAASVIMFLSVTNIITYEVAPLPLLWVIPLCIYLASFVLNFQPRPWVPAWINDKFYLTFSWSIVLFFLTIIRVLPFVLVLALYCFFLFHACMFCQYQLFRTRPEKSTSLPLYYLIISAGGLLGGMFTTWVMPLISITISEYLLGLAAIALGIAISSKPQALGWRNSFFIVYLCCTLMFWPVFFKHYNFFGLLIIFLIFKICYQRIIENGRALFFSMVMILGLMPFIDSVWTHEFNIYRHRNYYGIYNVYYKDATFVLMHGTTIHGAQFKDAVREKQPLTYYHASTPVGDLLGAPKSEIETIGLIGLGTGALATYIGPNRSADFFEIDPDMYFVAHDLFTYLKFARGKINFTFGDARLTIKEKPLLRYDVLVVDAFSGDSVPVHLLTVDAIQEYRKHLAPGGVILFHISNRYLNFQPVLFSNANYLNAYCCYKDNPENKKTMAFASSWMALTWDFKSFHHLAKRFKWTRFNPRQDRLMRPWTDRYSNVLSILNLDSIFDSIRYFEPFYW